jgi:hypothetical protein
MSNIPDNIKKMWEEAAKKIIDRDPKKKLHSGKESLPKTGPKMVKYGEKEVGGKIHGIRDEKGNLKN